MYRRGTAEDPEWEAELREAGLTTQDYVVLGMVRIGARTGYEVKQMVEMSVRFFWTISHVQIYPALRRLEESGMVWGEDDPQGQRPRRVYEITEAGEEALALWLLEPAPIPFELRDLGMVKLFFAGALDERQAWLLLVSIRERSEERLAVLRTIGLAAGAVGDGSNRYPFLTLKLGIAYHQAMVDACNEFERDVLASRASANRT
jgi:PadR family transcriptional regulator, regulatory protein AphA